MTTMDDWIKLSRKADRMLRWHQEALSKMQDDVTPWLREQDAKGKEYIVPNMVDKQCKDTTWITPPHVVQAVREFFGGSIELDPATEPDNPTGAKQFYTKADNGLVEEWGLYRTFVNPPYGKEFKDWVRAIRTNVGKGTPIVALLPGNRTETSYMQDLLCGGLEALVFVRKRLQFLRPDGSVAKSNPYGSVLWVFNAAGKFFHWRALERLGKAVHILTVKGGAI